MQAAHKWMNVAWNELRVAEYPGKAVNPRIIEYHAKTSLGAKDDATAWCSSFVNWCMGQVGIDGTNSAWARNWLNWGLALTVPQYGCLVLVERNGPGGDSHVFFYLDQDDEFFYGLGGNQKDQVCVQLHPKKLLLGFRWPEYD